MNVPRAADWVRHSPIWLRHGAVSNGVQPLETANHGNRVSKAATMAVQIPLIVLATSTVTLRLWSRYGVKGRFTVDDVLIVLGWCCAFARTVISCMSADDTWPFSIHGPDHPVEIPYYQHIFERRIAYIFAATLIRLSIITYYLRIFPPPLKSLRALSWLLLFLTIAQFIEVFTVLLVFCKSIPKLWTDDYLLFTGSRCFSSSTYSYSAAIGDSILDCLIFFLPIPYVFSLSKLPLRQRLSLVVIFALGLLVCVVALAQIPFIKRREKNSMYFGGAINLLISIQLSLAIIAASLPDIRALIARAFPKFGSTQQRSSERRECERVGDEEDPGHARDGVRYPRRTLDVSRRVFRKTESMMSGLPRSLMSSRGSRMTQITQVDRSSFGVEDGLFERPRELNGGFGAGGPGWGAGMGMGGGVGVGVGVGRRGSFPRRGSALPRRPTLADIPLPECSEKSEGSHG